MSSGVKVSKEVETAFKLMQSGKKNTPWLIMKIFDDREVQIDVEGGEGDNFDTFREQLMKAKGERQARYAVYDVLGEGDEAFKGKAGKLLFILWSDDADCHIKQKMLYTSSMSAIKKACNGYHKEVECHCEEDLSLEKFRDIFKK